MEEMLWSKFSLIYSTYACIIDRSSKHGRMLWLSWYIRREIHQTSKTTDQSACFPLCIEVFSNILLQRMICMLDFHQPHEQARFRTGYSTMDHLQVVNQLQEKANEYNIPLCCAFVDYENSFDSTEFEPLFEGLNNQAVDEAFFNILQNLYSEATSVLRLHKNSEKFKLGRGDNRGDNISPKCHVCNTPSSTRLTGKQSCQDWRWVIIPPYFRQWYSPYSQLYLKTTRNAPKYPWQQQASRP